MESAEPLDELPPLDEPPLLDEPADPLDAEPPVLEKYDCEPPVLDYEPPEYDCCA